jgi:hypothetical protein
MKNLALIIIMIGFLTGGCFLLSQFLQLSIENIIAIILLMPLSIAIPSATGFLAMYLIERKKTCNTHKAILFPWIFLPIPVVILAILRLNIFDNPIVEVPLILVFLSAGGLWAHQLRLNKVPL